MIRVAPLCAFLLLALAAFGCADKDRLDVETFTGRWEAIEIDGEAPPAGRTHYLDFSQRRCRFHGVIARPDGTTGQAHDYTRACSMEQQDGQWRLIFNRERNEYMRLERKDGIVSLILPPQKNGETDRVLTRLKWVGPLPVDPNTDKAEPKP